MNRFGVRLLRSAARHPGLFPAEFSCSRMSRVPRGVFEWQTGRKSTHPTVSRKLRHFPAIHRPTCWNRCSPHCRGPTSGAPAPST
ncbi:hypothetical protein SBRY_40839 [Actinacidiphila bryophytorum]|uniref:Uncharacterized protein n=1 Tax=Actinacidiphila bryophytorum TaxID=1436133 RepID=A0A9W4H3W7_9ACTN|nr:hypothetical protein SBRY_40839 [Actinacidiphila bryophytorum]